MKQTRSFETMILAIPIFDIREGMVRLVDFCIMIDMWLTYGSLRKLCSTFQYQLIVALLKEEPVQIVVKLYLVYLKEREVCKLLDVEL